MSAAWICFFDTTTSAAFNCQTCENKKAKGCKKPTRQVQAVYECPICEGSNRKCLYCRGTNQIQLHRCPRATITPDLLFYIPYFLDYVINLPRPLYPNGKTRLYQPAKLLKLFSIWLKIYRQIERKQSEQRP